MTKLIAAAIFAMIATSASAKVIIVQDNGETQTVQEDHYKPVVEPKVIVRSHNAFNKTRKVD